MHMSAHGIMNLFKKRSAFTPPSSQDISPISIVPDGEMVPTIETHLVTVSTRTVSFPLNPISSDSHDIIAVPDRPASRTTSSENEILFAEADGRQHHFTAQSDSSTPTSPMLLKSTSSDHSSHENASIRACLENMAKSWEALRDKATANPNKYTKQIVWLDYFHNCKQASAMLDIGDNDTAMKYCNAAKALKSNHWLVYSVKAKLFNAMGEFDKVQPELTLMRNYLKNNKEETTESLAIYYGLKAEVKIKEGNVSQAQKQFQKVVRKLLEKNSISQSAKSTASGVSENTSDIDVFFNASEAITQNVPAPTIRHPFARGVLTKKKSDPNLLSGNKAVSNVKLMVETNILKLMQNNIDKMMHELDDIHEHEKDMMQKVDTVASQLDEKANIAQVDALNKDLSHATSTISMVQSDVEELKQRVEALEQYIDKINKITLESSEKIDTLFAEIAEGKILDTKMSELLQNPSLKEYYKASILAFMQAYISAIAVVSGDLVLNTGNIAESIAVKALGFIPFCGDALSTIAEKGLQIINEHTLRENAARLVRIANSPNELYEIAKEVAIVATQNYTRYEKDQAVSPLTPKMGLVNKILYEGKKILAAGKKIVEKITNAIEGGTIYQTEDAQNAYEDVCKAIEKWVKHVKQKDKAKTKITIFDKAEAIEVLKDSIIAESIEIRDVTTHTHATLHSRRGDIAFDALGHVHNEVRLEFITPTPNSHITPNDSILGHPHDTQEPIVSINILGQHGLQESVV